MKLFGKSKVFIALTAAAALLLAGCTAPEDLSAGSTAAPTAAGWTAAVTQTPRATDAAGLSTLPAATPASGAYPMVVRTEDSASADLDGDGTLDEVRYNPGDCGPRALTLTVNGTDYDGQTLLGQGFYSDNLEPACWCVVDLDEFDGRLEIAVMDYGPSSDEVTSFFRYDGGQLTYLGQVSGLAASSRGYSDLTFHGDGTVASYMRLWVLQTWFAPVNWRNSRAGGFEVVPQDLYFPDPTAVTTLIPAVAYTERDAFSARLELPAGTPLTLTATDDWRWVQAQLENGDICWLRLDGDWGIDVETPEVYLSGTEVLDGLFMAD